MNSQKINDLMDVLEREAAVYDDLLKISQNKTDLIVKGKVSEIDDITKIEQTLILSMSKLEEMRENIVNDLSSDLSVNQSEMTISELLKHIDGSQSQKLEGYKTKLLDKIKEIKEVNDLNSKLIQNSIDYINFSINLLSSAPADNNYGNTGATNETKKKTFFDIKL